MNLRYWSAKSRTRTPMARGLAFVLLAGIVYGVTFGSAHSHGKPSTLDSSIAAGQAGSTLSALHSQPGFECLVCLFHQNLFNSTVPSAGFAAASTEVEVRRSAQPVAAYSNPFACTPIARLSGRAPPLA